MFPIIKAFFILFIMVIHSESGRVKEIMRGKLDTISKKPKELAYDEYDDGIDDNSFYDDYEEIEIENSPSNGAFTDRLKNLPGKVLISLYNSVNGLKSGMGKIFMDRQLTEGTKQSLEAILGLFKDGFINAKDLAFG